MNEIGEKENVVIKIQKYEEAKNELDNKLVFTALAAAACAVAVAYHPSDINTVIAALPSLALGISAGKLATLMSKKINMKEEVKKYLEEQLEQIPEEDSIGGKSR